MFSGYAPTLGYYAESRMGAKNDGSNVIVRRDTGNMTQDESTGLEVPIWLEVHTNLPVRFPPSRGGASRSRTFEVGGVELTLGVREMHTAYGTTDLQDGDLALVVAGRALGTVWRIVDATPPADQATAYRLDVVAADRPTEWG